MNEPTEAQIKKFWIGIFGKDGVEFGTTVGGELVCYRRTKWIEEDEEWGIEVIPRMDSLEFIGFLFKYAVPVAIDRIMAEQECSSDLAYAMLFKKWLRKLELDIPNHEGTLYWTIWEVINEKGTDMRLHSLILRLSCPELTHTKIRCGVC